MAPDKTSAPITNFIPKVALGIAAHPDDLDFSAAGSVAAWAAAGAAVYYLILTNGDKGSADRSADPQQLTATRRQEQRDAARILGVKDVFFCDYEDGGLTVSMDVKRDIVRIIRQVRPDTVFTMDPTILYDAEWGFINHPDHRAAGQAALDAVYPLARDHLSFPELYTSEKLEPHKVATVLLTKFAKDCGPEACVMDITSTIDTKLQALAAHSSQISDMDGALRRIKDMAAKRGADCNVPFAEVFVRINIA